MKVCQACGDTYRDHVDFCFNDGEILNMADADAAAGLDHDSDGLDGLDAPLPRMVQGAQAAAAAAAMSHDSPAGSTATDVVRSDTVPTANIPADDDGDDVEALIEPDDLEPEYTPADIGGEVDLPEIEATEVGPAHDPTDPPRPSGRAQSNTATVPPAPLYEEGREPMRVAPLSEAETTPFVRPQRRPPADTDTPISSPRIASRTTTTPLHLPPPPKRRAGAAPSADGPDRAGLLWVGAIVMGAAIAVPFLAGVAVIWFVVVGIGGTGEDDDVVVIGPRDPTRVVAASPTPEPALEPVPVPPLDDGVAAVEDPLPAPQPAPAEAAEEPDPFEIVAPRPSSSPSPSPTPAPAPMPPVPEPRDDEVVPKKAGPVRVRLDHLPQNAIVSLDGKELPVRGGAVELPGGTPLTLDLTAIGHCPKPVQWNGSADAVEAALVPGCKQVQVMVFGPPGTFSVDGLERGETNRRLPVPEGKHACRITSTDGVHDWPCELTENTRIRVIPPSTSSNGGWQVE